MKLEPAVKKETFHITVGVLSMCAVMLLVYFVLGKFSLTVLWSALLSSALAILNFFLMCLSKQHEVNLPPVNAKKFSVLSYNVRMLVMIGVIIAAYLALDFNLPALLIPLIFPRITILIMTFTILKKQNGGENTVEIKPEEEGDE